MPATADDCSMRGLQCRQACDGVAVPAALSGGWARPLLPLLVCTLRSRRGLATGCMPPAFYKVPPGLLFPSSVARRSRLRTWPGGAEEVNGGCGEVALWKAGARACRRWAPP